MSKSGRSERRDEGYRWEIRLGELEEKRPKQRETETETVSGEKLVEGWIVDFAGAALEKK